MPVTPQSYRAMQGTPVNQPAPYSGGMPVNQPAMQGRSGMYGGGSRGDFGSQISAQFPWMGQSNRTAQGRPTGGVLQGLGAPVNQPASMPIAQGAPNDVMVGVMGGTPVPYAQNQAALQQNQMAYAQNQAALQQQAQREIYGGVPVNQPAPYYGQVPGVPVNQPAPYAVTGGALAPVSYAPVGSYGAPVAGAPGRILGSAGGTRVAAPAGFVGGYRNGNYRML